MHQTATVCQFSLVDAREHDEAIHEQKTETASANPEDEQSNPGLPALPCSKEKGPWAALLPEAAKSLASSAHMVAHQGPNAAYGLKVVVFVLALCGAPVAWIRAGAATPDVYEGHGWLQF